MPAIPRPYSRTQVVLHWATAAVLVGQYALNGPISAAWAARLEGLAGSFNPLVAAHVAGGVALVVLVAWRLVLKAHRPAPPPAGGGALLHRVAQAGHLALYAVLLAMAATGGAAWFGGLETAARAHGALKFALLLLIAGHVLAALVHHLVLRDGLMARMALRG